MKRLLVLTIALATFGCQQKEPKVVPNKIDSTLSRIFEKEFPNYETNEFIREKALATFTKEIDSLVPTGIIDDIPVKLMYVKKNPNGEGAITLFYTDNQLLKPYRISNHLEYNIIGLTPDSLAGSLSEESNYFIKGKKFKVLPKDLAETITDRFYFDSQYNLNDDTEYTSYQIGTIICEITKVQVTQ